MKAENQQTSIKSIQLVVLAVALFAGGPLSSRGQVGVVLSQQAYLKASNTAAQDGFGPSAAISGDTIVISAPFEDSSATGVNGNQSDNKATDSGAAYIFVRSGTNWVQQAYLKASNPNANDVFGWSVAIDGDTVVVGVKASNTGAGDNFGEPAVLEGDTLVVGAEGEDSTATGVNGNQTNNSATDSGAAYVFVRNGTNWTQQAYLKASNTGANDAFAAAAVSGDTVVVGAIGEGSNATGVNGNQSNNSAGFSGAAYVFTGLESLAARLTIEPSGDAVRVSWPLSAKNFALEQTSQLNSSAPTTWTAVPLPYSTNATQFFVTVPNSPNMRFYRLRKP